MTRLRSLIKEVLSTPPKKKDCNCGCGGCNKKSPILTESKVKHLISEGLQYHIDKKIQLHESVYRMGSEKHFELIREARALWVRGIIDVSEDDQAILETNLGHFGMYEGEAVPLDMPMVNEETVDWPKVVSSRYGEYKFVLDKVMSDRAKYKVVDVETGKEEPGGRVYGTPSQLQAAADDLIKPSGGRQSSQFEESLNEVEIGDRVKIDKNYGGGRGTVDDKVGGYVIINGKSYHESDVKVINPVNEIHKLLRQTNLSSEEYQKAKKLKGFNADDYTFSSDNNLYVKKSSLEEKKKAKSKKKDPPIGKPKRGGSKAYYVYVRDPKTKRIKKVSFGSGGLRAKIRNPKARKAFAKRHRCSEKNDRTKPSYWSCRLPRYAKQLGLGSNMNTFW